MTFSNRIKAIAGLVFTVLGAVIFTSVDEKVWSIINHKSLNNKTISVHIEPQRSKLMFYVRNNSDVPLDIVNAKVQISSNAIKSSSLGAYPSISKLYSVQDSSRITYEEIDGDIIFHIKLIQVVPAGGSDYFGVSIHSNKYFNINSGDVILSFEDIYNNIYNASY